jgi:glucose/mannose-6-phosphate isomerase
MKDQGGKRRINLTLERIQSLDSGDMLGKTLELPQQIERGLELGDAFAKAHDLAKPLVADWIGLGGSAVAGDLLQGFGIEPPVIPVRVTVRRFPRKSTDLRMLFSYSGYTVETVKAFEEVPSEQIWFSASSGGHLQVLADKARVPHLTLPSGYPPRAAVGFSLGAVLAIFEHLFDFNAGRPLDIPWSDLAEDCEKSRQLSVETNPALKLAASLCDRTPVIYTTDGQSTPPLAFRFRAQLAENSKVWSHSSDLPEMAHNEVESFATLGQVLPPPHVIFLGSWTETARFADPRPVLRELLDGFGIEHTTIDPSEIWGNTKSRLNSGLRMMLLLDAATIYLSILRATDPTEIPLITRLKKATSRA